MTIGKMHCNESRISLRRQLLFDVSLFGFHFVFTLQYLDYYYECPVKQTASLQLSWKPDFFGVFSLFLKR